MSHQSELCALLDICVSMVLCFSSIYQLLINSILRYPNQSVSPQEGHFYLWNFNDTKRTENHVQCHLVELSLRTYTSS